MISRRLFLQSISASVFMPNAVWGDTRKNDIFISGSKQNGGYNISAFNRRGAVQYDIALPERAHAIAINPTTNQGAIFARRPDTFVVVFDSRTGHVSKTLNAKQHRHFYGHGYFSSDGRYLFSTEKNMKTGQGLIGVWDAKDSYKRIDEIPAYGIGPHEMAIMPDNKTMVVAVGGIQTMDRQKMNIDTMQPSLNYIDTHSGVLIGKYSLAQQHHTLSIRHLDISSDGTVAFACQDQRNKGRATSLVGLHNVEGLGDNKLRLMDTPDTIIQKQKRYCGSVKIDKGNSFVAVSSPRGNSINIWDLKNQHVIESINFDDSCGIASTQNNNEFLLSSGSDGCMLYNVKTKYKEFLNTDFTLLKSWDNHVIGI